MPKSGNGFSRLVFFTWVFGKQFLAMPLWAYTWVYISARRVGDLTCLLAANERAIFHARSST